MAKYTFYKYNDNIASVAKINVVNNGSANVSTLATHTVVNIVNGVATIKNTAAAAGDFLVWRPYPSYSIYGDRYGKTTTPIATSTGELYGFMLKTGDKLVVEDNASISGLNNSSVITL